MPPREFQTPRPKREELKTYRELGLRRDLKSAQARRRVEAKGDRRVLGNGSGAMPYLVVPAVRYREVRLEIEKRLLTEAQRARLNLSAERLLEQLTPRIESLAYEQLAHEAAEESLGHVPLGSLGRALTKEERARFAASRVMADISDRPPAPPSTAVRALNHVLGSIEQRQSHNPARYQTVWAQVVGPEAAQQSQLEQIDATTQTAWFRCFNSVLSVDLQRRRGLAQKLSRALGVPVRQLRARF